MDGVVWKNVITAKKSMILQYSIIPVIVDIIIIMINVSDAKNHMVNITRTNVNIVVVIINKLNVYKANEVS